MNSSTYLSKDGIIETVNFDLEGKYNEKFEFEGKSYIISFEKSFFPESGFLMEFVNGEKKLLGTVNNNLKTALSGICLGESFKPRLFLEFIYVILYDQEKNFGEKIAYLHSMINNDSEFVKIHNALYSFFTYYEIDLDSLDILEKLFHMFIEKNSDPACFFTEIFNTHFSENVCDRNYNQSEVPYSDGEYELYREEYRGMYPRYDVKYLRFCFKNMDFQYSQHFLLEREKTDSYLASINKYIAVKHVFTGKNMAFVVSLYNMVTGSNLKYTSEKKALLEKGRRSSSDYDELEYGHYVHYLENDLNVQCKIEPEKKNYNITCTSYFLNYEDISLLNMESDDVILDASRMEDFYIPEHLSNSFTTVIFPKDMPILKETLKSQSGKIKNVIFPENLVEICDSFLCESKNVDIVDNLPETLETIGSYFMAYSNIRYLVLPKNLKKIKDFLNGCSKIETICVPDGLEYVDFARIFPQENPPISLYFNSKPENHPLYNDFKQGLKNRNVRFLIHEKNIPNLYELIKEYNKDEVSILDFYGFSWKRDHVTFEEDTVSIIFPEDNGFMNSLFFEYLETGIFHSKDAIREIYREKAKEKNKYSIHIYSLDEEIKNKINLFHVEMMKVLESTIFCTDMIPIDRTDFLEKSLPVKKIINMYYQMGSHCEYDNFKYMHRLLIYEYDNYYIIHEFNYTFWNGVTGCGTDTTIYEYCDRDYIDISYDEYFYDIGDSLHELFYDVPIVIQKNPDLLIETLFAKEIISNDEVYGLSQIKDIFRTVYDNPTLAKEAFTKYMW